MCSEIAAPAVGPNLDDHQIMRFLMMIRLMMLMMMMVMMMMMMVTNPGTTLTTPGGKPASFTSWATARPL